MPKAKKPLNIIKNDPWLEPYSAAIEGRHEDAVKKEKELTAGSKSDCTVRPTAGGCSANMLPTQPGSL